MVKNAPLLALISALLFGISPALAKMVIGEMSPILLAGLLYLGSGLGLQILLVKQKTNALAELRQLSSSHAFKLIGAIVCGGVLAPLCLAYGVKLASAFEVSLLLNLESVTTAVIAWLFFHEHVGKRVWLGKALIVLGAVVISVDPASKMGFSAAGLLLFLACLFWGIDNNLTRDVDELSPTVLASIKGLAAGTFNTALACMLGQSSVSLWRALSCLAIGSACYGLSLVLFIVALRGMGSARTTTYFAAGPFFGMLFAMLVLGERPLGYQWLASLLMLVGIWALYWESHEHSHTHEPLLHRHKHIHDEHHQHAHRGDKGPEPHDHLHQHEPITHLHAHFPDIHHRHKH